MIAPKYIHDFGYEDLFCYYFANSSINGVNN